MTEFLVVAPPLLLLGLGSVQAGLVYHGKTVLNYATFEAARVGATRHALPEPMLRELGLRLAPLQGGDGSAASAAAAIARSVAEIGAPVDARGRPRPPTELRVLNPTREAFAAWSEPSAEHAARDAIPNAHLRHRSGDEARAGVTLRDANLLKIEVVHGLELKIPVVNRVLTAGLALIDPENAVWYRSNRLPLKAVATVRMQSEVWAEALEPAAPAGGGGVPDTVVGGAGDADVETGGGAVGQDGGGRGPDAGGGECGPEGLPLAVSLIETSEYEGGGSCEAGGPTSGMNRRQDGSTAERC